MALAIKAHLAGDAYDSLPAMRRSLCGRWIRHSRIFSRSSFEMVKPAVRCQHCEKINAGRQAARALGVEDAVRALSTPSRPDGDPPYRLSTDDY